MRKIFERIIISLAALMTLFEVSSCNKFLNVVPDDGLATIETAFNLRSTAIRYLGTCYSYMTNEGDPAQDPGMLTGDELWDLVGRIVSNTSARVPNSLFQMARGYLSPTSVYGNDWASMYQGIRCCDILVDNIDVVPDMEQWEKEQWKSEVTFLKAYYHFNLIRKWGPIPVIEHSLPMDADVETVRVYRDNIDDCFDFVIALLDKAMSNLPLTNLSVDEYGRITKVICAALKARVCVYAASPLFNGNDEEKSLVDKRGVQLFTQKTEAQKLERWEAAVAACEEALALCEQANIKLYDKSQVEALYRMDPILIRDLTLRGAYCERWNSEIIWGNTQTSSSAVAALEQWCLPNMTSFSHTTSGYQFLGVPIKVAEQFYTDHGIPIEDDREWIGVNTMDIRRGDSKHAYYLEEGYQTCRLNFNREPRFYSSLGFDGGLWLGGLANYNDLTPSDVRVLKCRMGGKNAKTGSETGPVTGYYPKKMFPYRCTIAGNNSFTSYWFPFPMIRLTDLYLLYAEAINELEGPNGPHKDALFGYLNVIRERAGIPDVKTAWDEYSIKGGYYETQAGMRDIIHRERLNELAFESQRFWDIRRWKEASKYYSQNIYGFHISASAPEDYYVKSLIKEQPFGLKDYFWPIHTSYIEVNPNLVQNIGW